MKQSYGELTGMDIDSAEEGTAETNCEFYCFLLKMLLRFKD